MFMIYSSILFVLAKNEIVNIAKCAGSLWLTSPVQ